MHQHGFTVGEPVPPVIARAAGAPRFTLDEGAGRWVMVLVPGPGVAAGEAGSLDAMIAPHAACLHPDRALLVVIATERDAAARGLATGDARHLLWDEDGSALGALRAIRPDGTVRHGWLLLDPSRRVFGFWPLEEGAEAMATLAALPPPEAHAGVPLTAPVLIVPRVFEPAFCRRLIGLCRTRGTDDVAEDDADGQHRRRRRILPLEAQELQVQIRGRISMRLLPEIRRAFAFDATRMERYLVACYDTQGRAFYGPHRDNDEPCTAHRAFTVTINLNGGEYDGGDICFPEFGPQTYRAPPGGALVHSCALLHEVRPMKRGRRYACLLFLYDEEGERFRTAGRKLIDPAAA